MKSFVIIDSYNFMFKSYYALPPMQDGNNNQVGAIYGFCNTLMRYLSEHRDISYMAVACDSKGGSFRQDIYSDYKANRAETPQELVSQFPLLRNAIAAFGLNCVEVERAEADDVIATLVKNHAYNDIKVVIFSSDKDLMQLIGPNVVMFDTTKNCYITEAEVENKFGVKPELMIDYLALCGDSADNIPGVPGIGPKTAQVLLGEYGSLEGVLDNVDSISPVGRREKIKSNIEKARISRQLVELKDDLPLDYQLGDFEYSRPPKGPLMDFFDRYDFQSLKTRATKIFYVGNKERTEGASGPSFAKDAWDEALPYVGKVVCLPLEDHKMLMYSDKETALVTNLEDPLYQQIAQCAHILKVGYNLKSITTDFTVYDDLMLMHYSLYTAKTDLNQLVAKELGMDDLDSTQKPVVAKAILELHRSISPKLVQHSCCAIYFRFERPLVTVVKKMERNGVKINRKVLEKLSDDYRAKSALLQEEIFALANQQFNLGSPKQMAQVLFEDLALPKIDAKSNSTNQEVLEHLQELGYPIANKILEWRHYSKLISTYTQPLIKHADEKTDRVHTCYNLAHTTTGRFSSSNPNLQNIPIRNTDQIRRCFIGEDGNVLISADYSQIELRLLAYVARIEEMQSALDAGEDIHATTAATIFGLDSKEISPEMRRKAKAINFGIIYGITPYGLARQLKIPVNQAECYIKEYLLKYPGIKNYMEAVKQYAREKGYVRTIFGRRCAIEHINSSKASIRHVAERAAINAPLQGSAADIMKLALVEIDKECKSAKVVMQIHDEFVLEVEQSVAHSVASKVRSIMEGITVAPRLKVDISLGINLAEMTAIELKNCIR